MRQGQMGSALTRRLKGAQIAWNVVMVDFVSNSIVPRRVRNSAR